MSALSELAEGLREIADALDAGDLTVDEATEAVRAMCPPGVYRGPRHPVITWEKHSREAAGD